MELHQLARLTILEMMATAAANAVSEGNLDSTSAGIIHRAVLGAAITYGIQATQEEIEGICRKIGIE